MISVFKIKIKKTGIFCVGKNAKPSRARKIPFGLGAEKWGFD